MTKEEAWKKAKGYLYDALSGDEADEIIKALEQQPCGMTAEEYRQRMIQAFHNADTDELIAVCVLPTEKEFENLEWLLKNHYKKAPCDDAISREELLKAIDTWDKFGYTETGCFVREPKGDYVPYIHYDDVIKSIKGMPSVTQKSGKWILLDECANSGYYCSNCQKKLVKEGWSQTVKKIKYCPNCGAKMIEPQESEDKTE